MSEFSGLRVEGASGVVSDRSWFTEAVVLEIEIGSENWKDKQVLSLGSGKKEDDAQSIFPGAVITSIDPAFFIGKQSEYDSLPEVVRTSLLIRPEENNADNKIKGIGQKLPFAEGSFDLVTSNMAVPMNVPKYQQVEAIQESLRVCKPGGEIRMYPVNLSSLTEIHSFLEAGTGFTYKVLKDSDQKLLVITKD